MSEETKHYGLPAGWSSYVRAKLIFPHTRLACLYSILGFILTMCMMY